MTVAVLIGLILTPIAFYTQQANRAADLARDDEKSIRENLAELVKARNMIVRGSYVDFREGFTKDRKDIDDAYVIVGAVEVACPKLLYSCEVIQACLCVASGNPDAAVAKLRAAESHEKGVSWLEQLAFGARHSGLAYASMLMHTEALRCFEKACDLNPRDPDNQADAGQATLMGLNDNTDNKDPGVVARLEKAKHHLEQAIALDPARAAPRINLANVLHRLGRLPEALAAAKSGVELGPNEPVAHFNLGNRLRDMGQADAALAELGEAIRLRPNYARALVNRSVIRDSRGDAKGAMDDILAAIKGDPKLALAHYMHGVLLNKAGKDTAARTAIEESLALDDLSGPAHYAYARLLAKEGPDSWARARSEFETAIKRCPTDHFFHSEYGNLLVDMKHHVEALAAYDEAIRLKPDFAIAHGNRGYVLRDLNRPKDAEDAIDRALQIDPSLPIK